MNYAKFAVLAVLLAFALAQRTDIRLDLKAFRVVQTSPSEKLEEALGAKPGQIIEYQLNAQNPTDNNLQQVVLIIPIPSTTAYQGLSAQPLRLGELLVTPEFSFDGGIKYGKLPLKRKVRVTEGGKEVEKEVEVKPEEFTHVRWTLPQMGSKQTVQLKLRTVVR
jgi:uncharacterized repeat protein (TIGR01451 family)